MGSKGRRRQKEKRKRRKRKTRRRKRKKIKKLLKTLIQLLTQPWTRVLPRKVARRKRKKRKITSRNSSVFVLLVFRLEEIIMKHFHIVLITPAIINFFFC